MDSGTAELAHDREFLDHMRRELSERGFVTDEHDFAPYKDAIVKLAPEIQAELRARDPELLLESGSIRNHPKAGYAYYVFDRRKFRNRTAAEHAISDWLDAIYDSHEEHEE